MSAITRNHDSVVERMYTHAEALSIKLPTSSDPDRRPTGRSLLALQRNDILKKWTATNWTGAFELKGERDHMLVLTGFKIDDRIGIW